MTLEERIIALATAIGTDIKQINKNQGTLSSLNTTAKADIVSAINEVLTLANKPQGAQIKDTTTTTTTVWSSKKVDTQITGAIGNLRTELTAGASEALDTFKELADALDNDPSFATNVAKSLNNRVRFDEAQTLTQIQKKQACDNIGIGDPDRDFVLEYTTARG